MYIVTINDYNCVVCVAFISCNDNSDIYKLKKKIIYLMLLHCICPAVGCNGYGS